MILPKPAGSSVHQYRESSAKRGVVFPGPFVLAAAAQSDEHDLSQHDHDVEPLPDDAAPRIHGHSTRADAQAPIGVMGDHLHGKGEFMASYRYMRMEMDGNRVGTRDVSPAEVVVPGGTYGVSPLQMDMQMHMLGLMWAPTGWLTLVGLFPFVQISMDHVNFMGVPFTTQSSGIGDIGASALVKLFRGERHDMHANLGMTFPSGSIDRKDTVPGPMGPTEIVLSYPMLGPQYPW